MNKKIKGVNRARPSKTVNVKLTKGDITNLLCWYRLAHHHPTGRICFTPVRFCHETKKKILDSSKKLNKNKT